MRLSFLLDENILYHAIRGVDLHDRPDDTATRLIHAIVGACHSLVIHEVVRVRYIKILDRLKLASRFGGNDFRSRLRARAETSRAMKRAVSAIFSSSQTPSG